jgi:hypothetical protein
MDLPIPHLPLPGSHDPFRAQRRAWRLAHPSATAGAAANGSGASHAPLRALAGLALREREKAPASFAVHSEARGRAEAVLFEVKEGRTRCEVRTWRRAGGNA